MIFSYIYINIQSMPKVLIILLSLLYGISATAQNLVPNPSFENYNKCPGTLSQITRTGGYGPFPTVTDWNNPCRSTSDYFNACAPVDSFVNVPHSSIGYSYAHTGKGMAGIIQSRVRPNEPFIWREYVQCKLNQKLIAGRLYYVSFFVKFASMSKADHVLPDQIYPIDKIGAGFYANMVNETTDYLKGTHDVRSPQGVVLDDTLNWTRIIGTYVAKGNEEYMVIGTFDDGLPTLYKNSVTVPPVFYTYYFIDDVYVGEKRPTDTFTRLVLDTTLCGLPTQAIDAGTQIGQGNYSYQWSNGDTSKFTKLTNAGIYWRVAWNESSVYIDTFNVKILDIQINPDLGQDTTVCMEDKFMIGSPLPAAETYLWNTGYTGCCFSPEHSGTYSLTVSNVCYEESDEVAIEVKKCDNCFFIPSAFTPNHDGINDNFSVKTLGCDIPRAKLVIADRWGQIVFRTRDITDKWNGKYNGLKAGLGVYYYFLSYYSPIRKEDIILKGDITLLR